MKLLLNEFDVKPTSFGQKSWNFDKKDEEGDFVDVKNPLLDGFLGFLIDTWNLWISLQFEMIGYLSSPIRFSNPWSISFLGYGKNKNKWLWFESKINSNLSQKIHSVAWVTSRSSASYPCSTIWALCLMQNMDPPISLPVDLEHQMLSGFVIFQKNDPYFFILNSNRVDSWNIGRRI